MKHKLMELNTRSIEMAQKIADYIEHIKGGEVSAPALGTVFNLHPSNVRGYVSIAQVLGIPICSNHKGYFFSNDPAQIRATIEHMEKRIERQQQACAGLREAMKRYDL